MTKTAAPTTPKTTTAPSVPSAGQRLENLQQLRVGRELMDTAWRMTVPVVLFAGLGIFIDRSLGSKPWVTLLGMVIGFIFAGILVKRQIGDTPPFIPSAAYKAAQKAADEDSDTSADKSSRYRIFGYEGDKDYYNDENSNSATSKPKVKNNK